jgi:hypothetical protein
MVSKKRHRSVVLFEARMTSFNVTQETRPSASQRFRSGQNSNAGSETSLSPFAHYNSPGTIFIHHTTALAASMMRQHLGTCCYTASCLLTQTQKAGHVLSTNAPIRQSVRRTHSIAGAGSGFASSTQLSTLQYTQCLHASSSSLECCIKADTHKVQHRQAATLQVCLHKQWGTSRSSSIPQYQCPIVAIRRESFCHVGV